ncbi:MAG: VWA domain-containing protein [Prevotella sp.]|nr:VWA domain-containing protein [Prevotella sp.]
MFRFEDPQYLYLLLAVPVMAVIRLLYLLQRKKKLQRLGDPELVRQLMPDVSVWRGRVKFWLLQAALALSVVMLARPQMGTSISHEKRQGIEVIIAMDISNSMRAEDVSPTRLDRAKMMVENLVDHFTDDKIGLVVFAGQAFVQLPITSDFVSAKMFLQSISPEMINVQGTDLATAIDLATHSFTQQKGVGKAIVVITDGEDHEGAAIEAARDARKQGMNVYVLGIGSTQGAPIPMPGGSGHMTDRQGQVVMSRLNEQICRDVAAAGGGAYIHVENGSNAQQKLDSQLAKLARTETESTIYSEFDEQFQAFAVLVLLLLVVEAFFTERKSRLLSRLHLFRRRETKTVAVMVLAALLPLSVSAQTDRRLIKQGNKQFRQQQYDKAETTYRKALEANNDNPQAWYNLGNALMAQQQDSAAVKALEHAAAIETNPLRKAMAYHNMGVVCQHHKMYGEAIDAYKQALRNNPADNESRYNLELCKQQKKKQDQQQQDQKEKQQDKKGEDKKQQQDQKKPEKQKPQEQQQPEKPQMSKDNAEQMLNAAMQKEKQTQRKLKEAQQKAGSRSLEKNW